MDTRKMREDEARPVGGQLFLDPVDPKNYVVERARAGEESNDDDFDLPPLRENSQESSPAANSNASSAVRKSAPPEHKNEPTLVEKIQAKIKLVLKSADTFYQSPQVLEYLLLSDEGNIQNPFQGVQSTPGSSVAKIIRLRATHDHLLTAQKTLMKYLAASSKNKSPVRTKLQQWSDAIAPRIAEGNLNELQRAALVELIYRNLTIAVLHESRGQLSETDINRIIGSPETKLMKGAQQLNEKTSSWRGWKIAAGLGLIFLVGIPLVVVAGASIASGYGLPLAPFFTTMVSWNSGAVLGAIAYMMGLAYCKKQQWKREDSQEQLTSGGKVIPLTPTTQRIKEYLSNHKTITSAIVATPLIGGAAAVGTSFIKGVVPSIQSASLSMGDIWSAKAKASVALGDKVLTGGNVGVAGITALMLAVAGAGTDAIRRGLMLIFSDAWNDRKVRRLGLGFLREVTDPAPDPDPVQVGASRRFSSRNGQ